MQLGLLVFQELEKNRVTVTLIRATTIITEHNMEETFALIMMSMSISFLDNQGILHALLTEGLLIKV